MEESTNLAQNFILDETYKNVKNSILEFTPKTEFIEILNNSNYEFFSESIENTTKSYNGFKTYYTESIDNILFYNPNFKVLINCASKVTWIMKNGKRVAIEYDTFSSNIEQLKEKSEEYVEEIHKRSQPKIINGEEIYNIKPEEFIDFNKYSIELYNTIKNKNNSVDHLKVLNIIQNSMNFAVLYFKYSQYIIYYNGIFHINATQKDIEYFSNKITIFWNKILNDMYTPPQLVGLYGFWIFSLLHKTKIIEFENIANKVYKEFIYYYLTFMTPIFLTFDFATIIAWLIKSTPFYIDWLKTSPEKNPKIRKMHEYYLYRLLLFKTTSTLDANNVNIHNEGWTRYLQSYLITEPEIETNLQNALKNSIFLGKDNVTKKLNLKYSDILGVSIHTKTGKLKILWENDSHGVIDEKDFEEISKFELEECGYSRENDYIHNTNSPLCIEYATYNLKQSDRIIDTYRHADLLLKGLMSEKIISMSIKNYIEENIIEKLPKDFQDSWLDKISEFYKDIRPIRFWFENLKDVEIKEEIKDDYINYTIVNKKIMNIRFRNIIISNGKNKDIEDKDVNDPFTLWLNDNIDTLLNTFPCINRLEKIMKIGIYVNMLRKLGNDAREVIYQKNIYNPKHNLSLPWEKILNEIVNMTIIPDLKINKTYESGLFLPNMAGFFKDKPYSLHFYGGIISIDPYFYFSIENFYNKLSFMTKPYDILDNDLSKFYNNNNNNIIKSPLMEINYFKYEKCNNLKPIKEIFETNTFTNLHDNLKLNDYQNVTLLSNFIKNSDTIVNHQLNLGPINLSIDYPIDCYKKAAINLGFTCGNNSHSISLNLDKIVEYVTCVNNIDASMYKNSDIIIDSSKFGTINTSINKNYYENFVINSTNILNNENFLYNTKLNLIITQDAKINLETRYSLSDPIIYGIMIATIVYTSVSATAAKTGQVMGNFVLKVI